MTERLAKPPITAALAADSDAGPNAEVDGRRNGAGGGCPVRAARLRIGAAMPWSRTTRLVGTMALVPAVLVAGALAGCTPTPGGTASVAPGTQDYFSSLHFDAVSGRNNDVVVALDTQGPSGYPVSLLLTDSRNPVTPGSGCTPVKDNAVRCSIGATGTAGFDDQIIRLGDGNDTFASAVTLRTVVDAGLGEDTLNGGPSENVLRAGSGNDIVNGGPAKDEIDAGAGNDSVNGGPGWNVVHAGPGDDSATGGSGSDWFYEDSDELDHDSFSGGAGSDSVHYAGVLHAVNISLNDVADDGRPGEGDNVKSDIEDVMGTGNADTVTGDGDANRIYAIGVDDFALIVDYSVLTGGAVMSGGGGNDLIYGTHWGGHPSDRLSGGAGNDELVGFAGDDVLSGGAGDDRLTGWDGFDALDGGTETDYCDVDGGPEAAGGTAVNCETGPSAK